MEIIGKIKGGVLISATDSEVKEILRATLGQTSIYVSIGIKIPAIDYATTITKIKQLSEDYAFRSLLTKTKEFVKEIEELTEVVRATKNTQI